MSAIDSAPFSLEEIASESIKPDEYEEIVKRLGRHPNKAELGMFGVMWSEHCCYKNSRPLLKQFPTSSDRVVVGPGENAGVIDLGEGLQLAFKVESHNHPSAVEPFQGAATGVGGILRDIFTMGARPIAILNSLRFGTLDQPGTRRIFTGVVAGISHYGNSVGVPTVGGEIDFDPAYSGNPLINVMAAGLMETSEVVKAGASGIGNPVIYVGSTTGRDGMGGASFASSELEEDSEDDRPAVQVGDPFLEKSLIEACLEAFQTGAVVAAQDMGAAGLTCSTSEMAEKGGVGIELNLDMIPHREPGMTAYEYLLSESQERMLLVAEKGREQELIDIFQKWELHAVVAGEVITDPIIRITQQGEIAAEIPASALAEDTPVYEREILAEPPSYAQTAWQWTIDSLPECDDQGITDQTWQDILLQLLATPSVASKAWVYRQYDHQVQNNTVLLPGHGDATVIRVRPQTQSVGTNKGMAATTDCNARYVYLDPYEGAQFAVAEAARNLSCVGAEPVAITNNLNFGSPEKSVGYWQLAKACEGIAQACAELETPVTGGNVSLYNETLDNQGHPQPTYPTPVIGMVGVVEDVRQVCGQGWQKEGDLVYLLGNQEVTLAGSQYLATIHQTVAGKPPRVNLKQEKQVQQACRKGIQQGLVQSAHDCAEGGIAVALAECCLGGNLGVEVTLSPRDDQRWDECFFGEAGARIVASIAPEKQQQWETLLQETLGNAWQPMGIVTGKVLKINANLVVSLDEIKDKSEGAIASKLMNL